MKNRLHQWLFFAATTFASMGFSPLSLADVCQFIPLSGQWDNASNWSNCTGGNGIPLGTPGPADRAEITGKTAILPAGTFAVGDIYMGSSSIQGAGIASTTLNIVSGGTIAGGSGSYTFQALSLTVSAPSPMFAIAGPWILDVAQLDIAAGTTLHLSDISMPNGGGTAFRNFGTLNLQGNINGSGGVFFNNAGAVLSVQSTISISGPFSNAGLLSIPGGVTLTLANAANFSQIISTGLIQGDGTIDAMGQTLTLAGGVADGNLTFAVGTLINSGATLRPAGPGTVGTININGNYVQQIISPTQFGSMEFDLASLGSFDRINVSGTADIQGGNIGRGALGTFAPPVGTILDVLVAGSVTGSFSGGTELIVFDAPRRYTPIFSPTEISLQASETVWVIGSTDDESPTQPSLRNALAAFNAESSSSCGNAPYSIHFFLGGSATIQPGTPLPAIGGCPGLLIDGYSEAGALPNSSSDWNASLPITLNGGSCPGCNGLTVSAANTTVKGINFANWPNAAINVDTGGNSARIQGNYFFQGNYGVYHTGATDVRIGQFGNVALRNVFVHAAQAGIYTTMQAGGPPLIIEDNLIGAGAGLMSGPNAKGIMVAGTNNAIISKNYIANNVKGLVVQVGTGIDYSGSNIFFNNGIGADLGDDGPTANDEVSPPYDTDSGANQLLNFPNILSVTPTSVSTANINYELRSSAGSNFQICFCKNPSGGNQCEQPVPTCQPATTDANGLFTNTIGLIGLTPGTTLTTLTIATAGPKSGNVSEISPSVPFTAPGVTLSANPIVIPATPLNWTRALFVNATNSTASAVTFSPPSMMGDPEINVSVNQVPNCISGTIPAMGQCAFIFNFTPTATIAYSSMFSLSTSAGLLSAPVSSSGITSIAFPTVAPPTVNFPVTPVMTLSAPQMITFSSPAGGATVQFQDLGGITGTDAGDFNFASDACSNQFVSAGTNCIVQARFAPNTLGTKSAGFSYLAVEPSGSFRFMTVGLAGTAAAGTPAVTIGGSSAFPNTTVGSSSAVQAITITNSGGATITLNSITHTNASIYPDTTSGPAPNAAHWCGFGSVAGGAPNTGSPINIAPGNSCTLNLIFSPNATGSLPGTITINSNASPPTNTISLSGTGLSAATPTMTVAFAPGSVGAGVNATLTVTITNPAASGASIGLGSLVNVPSLSMSGLTDSCSLGAFISGATIDFGMTGNIPAMSTCTVTVQAQSAMTGSFPVTVMPGNLMTSQGNNANSSTATLTVAPSPPGITVSLPTSTTTVGTAVMLRFTITTPVANGFTGGSFTFTHPAGVVTGATPGITNGCGGTITSAPGSSTINAGGLALGASNLCQINVNVSSAAASTYNFAFPVGGLTTSSGNNAAASSATLTVTPASSPAITLTPPSVAFGARTVNTTSPISTVTLDNSGSAPLTISSITSTGDFAVVTSCPLGPTSTLANGLSCPLDITFTPLTVSASLTGNVTIVSDAPGSPHVVPLSGAGTATPVPVVNLNTTLLNFPNQVIGTTSATQTINVYNSGFATLFITSITKTGSNAFTRVVPIAAPLALEAAEGLALIAAPDCSTSVPPGGSCTISVVFTPAAVGTVTGQINIATNAGGSPHIVNLTGTGISTAVPIISVADNLSFGDQIIGTGGTQTLNITNSGGAPMTISSITVSGANAANFVTSGSCTTVAAGASCAIVITFTPTSVGAKTALITIASNGTNAGTTTVGLAGNGILSPRPIVELSVTTIGYGNAIFAGASSGQVITLKNAGGTNLQIQSLFTTGDFVVMNSCPTVLAGGSTCVINVTFSPLGVGQRTGELVLISNAQGSPHRIPLSGTGCRWFSQAQSRLFLTSCAN